MNTHFSTFSGLLGMSVAALSTTTSAQTPASSELEKIVVSAQQQQQAWLRTAAAIEVKSLTQQDLATDLAAVLQGMPGLQADQRANLAQDSRLSIRGFGSRSSFGVRGIEVMLDDIPWSTPDGQSQPGSMLLAQLGSVEVLRGPAAVMYGNASGGVLALRSAPLTGSGLKLQQSYGADLQQQLLVLGLPSQQLALSRARYDGYRLHNQAEKRQASWRSEWSTDWQNPIKVHLRYDWSDDPLMQDPLALTAAEWQADPQQTNPLAMRFNTRKSSAQRQFSLQLQPETPASQDWKLSFWHGQRDIEQYLAFTGDAPTSSGGVVALERYYRGIKAQHSWQWQAWTWQLSTQLDQQRDLRQGFVNRFGVAGDRRRHETGMVDNVELAGRSLYQTEQFGDFTAALKWSQLHFDVTDYFITPLNPDDSGQRTLSSPSLMLGWNYLIQPNLAWYISYGEGFESPTLAEMAYQRDSTGLNLGLQPTKNQQTDTGLKWQYPNATVALDVFYADTQDELVVDQATGGRTSFRNAAATRRFGAEGSWWYRWSHHVQHQLSVSWLDARFAAESSSAGGNTKLPGVAPRQASYQLIIQPNGSDFWQLSGQVQYKSSIYTDDANRHSAPASTLLHLHSRWRWQHPAWYWQLLVAADNVTDRSYVGAVVVNQTNGRSFEPGLPRQVQVALQGQWWF